MQSYKLKSKNAMEILSAIKEHLKNGWQTKGGLRLKNKIYTITLIKA